MVANGEYSIVGLHLPENRSLVNQLRKVAQVLSLGAGLGVISSIFLGQMAKATLTTVVFLAMVVALILKPRQGYGLITTIAGGVAFTAGFWMIIENTDLVTGSIFLMMGLALVISQTKIGHRYHVVHILALIAAMVSFVARSWVGVILSLAILLRWPNRGFVSMFCLDVVSTKYALGLLAIKITAIVGMSYLGLWGVESGGLSHGETIWWLAITLVIVSVILAWLQLKLVYKFNLEHFVMKEALRVNNISIKMSNEELARKMAKLEETQGVYVEKLKYQDKFRNIAEDLR